MSTIPTCSAVTPSTPYHPPGRITTGAPQALRSNTPMSSRGSRREHVAPLGSFRFTHRLSSASGLERSLEEAHVRPAELFLDVVEEQRGPRVHRCVHVAEVPFRWFGDLTIGIRRRRSQHQEELFFREIEVDDESDKVLNARSQAASTGLPHLSASDDVAVQHVRPVGVFDWRGPHSSGMSAVLGRATDPRSKCGTACSRACRTRACRCTRRYVVAERPRRDPIVDSSRPPVASP